MLSPTLTLLVVMSGRDTIPSLQALLQISGVTGTLFLMIGVCWNFQCEYAPQYPRNSDTEARQLTPDVFFYFLGLRTYVSCSTAISLSFEASLQVSGIWNNWILPGTPQLNSCAVYLLGLGSISVITGMDFNNPQRPVYMNSNTMVCILESRLNTVSLTVDL